MSLDGNARAVVMVPQRDATTIALSWVFREAMQNQAIPLACVEGGIVPGQDDWGEDDETPQVACWWGVFQRRQV